jgi:hypothetical protein
MLQQVEADRNIVGDSVEICRTGLSESPLFEHEMAFRPGIKLLHPVVADRTLNTQAAPEAHPERDTYTDYEKSRRIEILRQTCIAKINGNKFPGRGYCVGGVAESKPS